GIMLEECIDSFVREEKLNINDLWYCSQCKKHQQAYKKIDLWSFPEILIIHLKRFQVISNRSGRSEKINTLVDFPIQNLDLSKYIINKDLKVKPIYDLYAVSCHSG